MKKTSSKPGVMIYFDILNIFPFLSNAEKGILFEAMMRYGKEGTEPDLESSKLLNAIWCLMKARLDADDARYNDVVNHRKYAAYVRWCKKKDQEAMDYDTWVESGGPSSKQTYEDASDALA